jgi:benzoate membrane transport protein
LQEVTKGPLVLGPLIAFAISLSQLELFGFGRFFWALVLGLAVSWLLERDGMRSSRSD